MSIEVLDKKAIPSRCRGTLSGYLSMVSQTELEAMIKPKDSLADASMDRLRKADRPAATTDSSSGKDCNKVNKNRIGNRYNGLRPSYATGRVSLDDYPDPTGFGWIFTGSNETSLVEMFEKQIKGGRLNYGLIMN